MKKLDDRRTAEIKREEMTNQNQKKMREEEKIQD